MGRLLMWRMEEMGRLGTLPGTVGPAMYFRCLAAAEPGAAIGCDSTPLVGEIPAVS